MSYTMLMRPKRQQKGWLSDIAGAVGDALQDAMSGLSNTDAAAWRNAEGDYDQSERDVQKIELEIEQNSGEISATIAAKVSFVAGTLQRMCRTLQDIVSRAPSDSRAGVAETLDKYTALLDRLSVIAPAM